MSRTSTQEEKDLELAKKLQEEENQLADTALRQRLEAEAASEAAVAKYNKDLHGGARDGGLPASQRRSSANVNTDATLAELTQNLDQADLDSESSTDMRDEEYAQHLQKQEQDLASQERRDAEFAARVAEAEIFGTTGALKATRTLQLQPEHQRGGGMSRGGSSSPSKEEETDC